MADIVDRATRSRMMAGIRGRDTTPERIVRSHLHRAGLRFRLHESRLSGRPDIVLPRWGAVVFVHGCYWHRHPGCRFATTPSTRVDFWMRKFAENVARDRRNIRALRRAGWRVFVVWECRTSSRALDALVRGIRT
jgi:DNA mismatch endonuclease (patch repair protein)